MDRRHSALRRDLLSWYAQEGRDLPWRRTRDPYRVLVSEVMLQQTQVARVVPLYERFIERWPTAAALAAAPLAEVIVAWKGLGYNRRARALQGAAIAVTQEHGGRMPVDPAELRRLPGVGPYTARAVAAFAADAPCTPVDVNVARVLSRAVAGRAVTRGEAEALGDRLLGTGSGRQWASALMDLGARVCTARSPACARCPVARSCAWRRAGGPDAATDPAMTGAGRSRAQAPFTGSDRSHRGRIIDALRVGPIARDDLPAATGVDPARLERLVAGLVRDGLAEVDGGSLRLPGAALERRQEPAA